MWSGRSLIERVHQLRYILPLLLALVVVIYQLGIAQALERLYGHFVHYSVEIGFYSLTGPVVTWLVLAWIERNLVEKERLEREVQAAQQERAAILEEERARIARDLHDGVAQTLYFLALKADKLRQQVALPESAAELQQMGQKMRQVIRDVRRTIFALHPLDWSKAGFVATLCQYVQGFAEQMGWRTEMAVADGLAVPARLEATLFRLVQESLNNVAKHAAASQIWVSIVVDSDRLQLTIRDDGQGFVQTDRDKVGLGLAQMQKRVTDVGGTFYVQSEPGEGTAVIAELPLPDKRHE